MIRWSLLPVGQLCWLLGLFAGSICGSIWLAARGYMPLLSISIPLGIWAVYKIFDLFYGTLRKVTFMFNAIENDDYAFKFTEDPNRDDHMFNSVLNRIRSILSDAKQRAVEREKYFELIIDGAQTGIVTLDEKGAVYNINREALRIFGLPRMTHLEQLRPVSGELAEQLRNIESGEQRSASFADSRGATTVSLRASGIKANGKSLRVVFVADLSNELDEKELESWSRLIRVLTHEIMNSLSPIVSLSDALIDINEDKQGDLARGLETIASTSRSLISFVDSYRKLSRVPTPEKELFPVGEFLSRTVALHGASGGCATDLRICPEEMLVYADPNLAMQVLTNLIRNAVQAMEGNPADRPPRMEIAARIDPSENIVIEVTNNGDAIPPEVAGNIFMPFFTTKSNGSGIGLSLSRQIMLLHNGSIKLTANRPGRVTFTLVFGG